jgi:glycosidase
VTSVKPPTVRFSGYRYDKNGKPELFLPGFQDPKITKVQAQILSSPDADAANADRVELTKDTANGYWRLQNHEPLKPGAVYRFEALDTEGKPVEVPLDYLETVTVHNSKTKQADTFNRIALHDLQTPQKSSVIADIYADSILTQDQIKAVDAQQREQRGWDKNLPANRLPVLPIRNHFNKFNKITLGQPNKQLDKTDQPAAEANAKVAGQSHEDGLNELIPSLKEQGFSAILFKPFIGGDNLSSHRYWTTDPYILNDTFRNKETFRDSLDMMLKNGMKVIADGAFVNQGMNGVQILSNLRNRANSPYWGNWFHFGENETSDRTKLPSLAQEPYKFGILPTKTIAGRSEVDFDAFAIRILNNPVKDDYQAVKPTFIELYDPRLEDEQGHPKPVSPALAVQLKSSKNSVQKYRFPVDPKEVRAKLEASSQGLNPKAKFLDWKNLILTTPENDHSSKKWDGQLDVALMNTQSPEVVNYLKGAVNYWSRMVMNHYTRQVAVNMAKAKQALKAAANGKEPTAAEILAQVTQKDSKDQAALAILPPVTHPVDQIDAERAEQFAQNAPSIEAERTGPTFAHNLLENVPLNTVPFPILFKANLNEDQFLKALPLRQGKLLNALEDRFLTLIDIPYVGKPFEYLSKFVFSPKIEKALGRKMQQIFNELSTTPKAGEKLRHENIQAIVADQLGEPLYISLITGKSLERSKELAQDPEKLEEAFYESLPPSLIQASPKETARRLPALIRQRLRDLNYPGPNNGPSLQVQIREEVEKILEDLDPSLVNLASNVLKEREFGLNWRIDAAKDVADLDKVRQAPNTEKAREAFREQVKYLNEFWGQKLGDAMRGVFPKASVIAELTDFGALARDDEHSQEGQALKKSLFVNNTFTSAPNMEHAYSPLLQMVSYAQRPDEFGASQMTPNHFLKNHVEKMTQEVPLFTQRHFQNLTASHDYSTTSHALLINPELFNQDRSQKPGLLEFMDQGLHEVQYMPSFAHQRAELKQTLGLTDDKALDQWLTTFRKWLQPASNADIPGTLAKKDPAWPPEIYTADAKAALWDEKTEHDKHYLRGALPLDLRNQFPSQLRKLIETRLDPKAGLGSNDRSVLRQLMEQSPVLKGTDEKQQAQALNTLEKILQLRMAEPGEAKAMRGVINNAVATVLAKEPAALTPAQQEAIWKGVDEAIQKWGAHFGYMPLDAALNEVFHFAHQGLTESKLPPNKMEALKLKLYNTAMSPVLAKQERIFAIQNALPGNPSVYLPDLFAQGGSEFTKNIYSQNRGIIRADRLQENPKSEFGQYWQRVGQIFNSRNQLPVLTDGIVLPVETNDAHGILPIIRDNGKDQVIVLVDTGKPNAPNGKAIPALDTNDKANLNRYSNVQGEWTKTNRKLSAPLLLKSDHLKPGTTYTDFETKERFKLNAQGELVKLAANGRTEIPKFEIKANRILVRD